MKRVTCLVLGALLTLPAAAQIYRTVDADGNVVFTDTPPADGSTPEEVQLNQTNTVAPPPPRPQAEPAPEPAAEPEAAEFTVEITAPTNETTIPMGPGNFSVSARVAPGPGAGESVQLFMDGTPWGEPQKVPSWALTNVFRGAHDLVVAVVDDSGKQLAASEPVRVYVLRPSVNFRNRN